MAIKEFTGELDPVEQPKVMEFTGELDPVQQPKVMEFTGKLDPVEKPKEEEKPKDAEIEQIKKDYALSPDMDYFDYSARMAKRAGKEAAIGFEQSYEGLKRFTQDTFGIDSSKTTENLDKLDQITKAIGQPENHMARLVEGAGNSIIQNLPIIVGGIATAAAAPLVGGAALATAGAAEAIAGTTALTGMFMQSFGQTYDESRREKLDYKDAVGRSAAFAALEVIGEKLGLGDEIKGIKAAAKGVPTKDLAMHFGKALVKEVPGEELTYAGQFAVDKGYGMNPAAGFSEFIQGAIDTLGVTVLQGTAMGGAGAAVNKAVNALAKPKTETETKSEMTPAETQSAIATIAEGLAKKYPNMTPEEINSQAELVHEATQLKQSNPGLSDEEAINAAQQSLEQKIKQEVTPPTPPVPPINTSVTSEQQAAPPAPSATPQVLSAAGTPIKIEPLNQLGVKNEQPSNGTISGTGQPSIPVSGQGTNTAEGTAAPIPTRLENTVGPSVGVGGGEETVPNVPQTTLEKPKQEAVDYLGEVDSGKKRLNPSTLKRHLTALGLTIPEAGKGFAERAAKVLREAVSPPSIATTPTEVETTNATPYTEVTTPEATTPEATTPEITTPEVTTPPVKNPKGAGRKAEPKTPEQIAADKATATQQSAANKAEVRRTQNLLALLKQNTERAEDVELMGAERKQEHRAERISLLAQLEDISKGPQRDNAAGKLAKEELAKATEEEKRTLNTRREERAKLTPEQRASIDAKLKADTETRIADLKKKAKQLLGKASKSQTTNSKPNQAFNGDNVTNAEQALNIARKTGTMFERTLIRALMPFMKNVGFIVVNSKADLAGVNVDGESLESIMSEDGSTNGMMVTIRLPDGKLKKMIYVRGDGYGPPSMHGINNTTVIHEALHAALDSMLDTYIETIMKGGAPSRKVQALYDNLFDLMDRVKDSYDERRANGEQFSPELGFLLNEEEVGGINILDDAKEFLAYGLSDENLIDFLLETPGSAKKGNQGFFGSLFSRFANALRNALGMGNEHQSAMQDLLLLGSGLLAEKPVNAKLESVSFNKKLPKINKNLEKLRLSQSATDVQKSIFQLIREAHSFEDIKQILDARWNAFDDGAVKNILKTLPTSDILRWAGNKIPGLKDIDIIAQKMATARTSMLEAAAKKADQLGDYIRKNKNNMANLARAMHLARLENVSPMGYKNKIDAMFNDKKLQELTAKLTDPSTNPASLGAIRGQITLRENSIERTFEAWDKLDEEGKQIYGMVKNFYSDNLNKIRELLDAKINRLQIATEDKKTLLGEIRKMQEQGRINEYFPFMRDGIYWLSISKGPTGREFYLFDTGTARNIFAEKRAKELGLNQDEMNDRFNAGNDITSLRNSGHETTQALKDMFEIIDKAAVKGNVDANAIKDELYQTYLRTMPERSFRKQFITADNITGFSADIFRNFKTSATRLAGQASKLQYSDSIEAEIQRAKDSLEGMPLQDKTKYGEFINEMATRAKAELNPPEPNQISSLVNQFAYYWLLTAPASAAIQLASIPIMVLPNMYADYGAVKSTAMFTKYSALWKSLGLSKGSVSVGDSAFVKENKLLSDAFDEAVARGITTATNTAILTNRGRTPDNSYDSLAQKAGRQTLNIMSGLFNGAERISREMTYMMVFEAEYEKTKDFEGAVQKAVDKTHELLGRYDTINRPTVLKNFAGKTLGQFKMYAANVTSYLVRNAYTAFKEGMTEEEGRQAMKRLGGTLAMGGLFHGLVGMPLYSTICATIDMILDAFDDEDEKRRRRGKNPITSDNFDLRFRYEILPDMFGPQYAEMLEKGPISSISGMNIGSRTSMDGMWFRDSGKASKTNAEAAQNFLLANLGPGVSTGLNMVSALDDFNEGHTLRALEKMVPAFFKNPIVTYRLATEGAETKGGDSMLKPEELSTLNLIGQSIGFQPTKLSRLQEEGFKTNQEVAAALNQKQKILQRIDEVFLSPSSEDSDKERVMDALRKHNERYPVKGLVILPDTLIESLRSASERRGLTYRGQHMEKKLMPYLVPLRMAASPEE